MQNQIRPYEGDPKQQPASSSEPPRTGEGEEEGPADKAQKRVIMRIVNPAA